jgi:predicted GIY-YIG superfamily endonuclease
MSEAMFRVYVIELDDSLRKGTAKPAVYVGQSAKSPEERFAQHLRGERASRYVRDHGVRLRPRLYNAYLPVKTRAEAEALERRVGDRLRRRGFTVYGAH